MDGARFSNALVFLNKKHQFIQQELAYTAWAFASVNLLDEMLFRALAREAEHRLSELIQQELKFNCRRVKHERIF